MFKTKLEIDRHVEDTLRKVNSERERNKRSLSFAKLYFNIGEYECARRYIVNYLTEISSSSDGHLLLGKILEKLGKFESAVDAYRSSLDYDPKQKSLVLKVCELLASDEVSMDVSRARYWLEKGQKIDPKDPAVFALQAKITATCSSNPDDIFHMFLNQLEHNPTDISLRIRLLNHLVENNELQAAYNHILDIENKNFPNFNRHFAWYETVLKVVIMYFNQNLDINSDFWIFFISISDKCLATILDQHVEANKSITDIKRILCKFDQTLTAAAENLNNCTDYDKQFIQEFLNHYQAQLCFHLAVLLFKKAKKDLLKYKDAIDLSLPLLLISYHTQPVDLKSVWLCHSPEHYKDKAKQWNITASYRCSQAGHMLLAFSNGKSKFSSKIESLIEGNWREKIYQCIFTARDQQNKINQSYFVTSSRLQVVCYLPQKNDLYQYDLTAQLMTPDSLHHLIWIGLYTHLPSFQIIVFKGLELSVKNLSVCTAESLNVLDILSFLYCCVFSAKGQMDEVKNFVCYSSEKPSILPAAIMNLLGTEQQRNWFKAAYQSIKKEISLNYSENRLLLIKGIEIIRCVGAYELDLKLLISLARTFTEKSKLQSLKQTEQDYIEARAELYWNTALPLIEKQLKNQAITYSAKRWFECKGKNLNQMELDTALEDCKLFLACQLMKRKQLEKATELLKYLKSPYATYYQAENYKKLADEQIKHHKENLTSEMRSQNVILLSKAREALYLTLDRLREPSVDRNHPLNAILSTKIDEIESALAGIDPDISAHRNDYDGISDDVSSVESLTEPNYSVLHSNLEYSMTPRRITPHLPHSRRTEARPSPERLDAQIRQIMMAKDNLSQILLDQNRLLNDTQRVNKDELRGLKDSIDSLHTKIDALTKTFTDSITDAISRLLIEPIQEIKRDIQEIKKNKPGSSSQINEEDLYALEEDYSDYSNFAPNNLCYNPRTNIQNPPFAGLYPSLYPPLYPPYAVPTLPFPTPAEVPDFRGLPTNLFPQPQPQTQSQPQLQLSQPTGKTPPVNVVITASDPLPTTSVAQPILSVTIPPQHLKSQPHNYQIPLPATTTTTQSPLFFPQTTVAVTTQSLLASIGSPIFSSLTTKPQEKSMNSTTLSVDSIEEIDPCPDFKPIIPLPDEVPVTTGEENEEVLFSERAKLFRFVEKEWRERGTGTLKILRNKTTNKVRLLMRRDQVLKICANHFITPELTLSKMQDNDRTYVWAANDYADENVILEKFCVRFKTAEIAKSFYDSFEKAKQIKEQQKQEQQKQEPQKIGGFVFNNTPAFKPDTKNESTPIKTASPFAGFSFTPSGSSSSTSFSKEIKPAENANKSHDADEFVPTAEFKPVIPLPELVDVKTGEENSEVIHEVHAKLLRYDTTNKEWKECGIGVMKILKDKIIRLLMRRDQVLKICCNHQLLKSTVFTNMPKNNRAINWCAQDFSDNVLKTEMFAMKFKTVEQCTEFLKKIEEAQKMLDSSNNITTTMSSSTEKHKTVWECSNCYSHNSNDAIKCSSCDTEKETAQKIKLTPTVVTPNKPKFLPWQCKTCFIHNEGKTQKCEACDSLKSDSVTKKPEINLPTFGGWGDQFKPKTGSWECKACYITNESDKQSCVACQTPKDGSKNQSTTLQNQNFNFGIPAVAATATNPPTSNWGNLFKPKVGNWECKTCYVSNEATAQYCSACQEPKDAPVVKKDDTSQKFSFGIQKQEGSALNFNFVDSLKITSTNWECQTCKKLNDNKSLNCISCKAFKNIAEGEKDVQNQKFSFGIKTSEAAPVSNLNLTPKNDSQSKISSGFTTSTSGFNFGTNQSQPMTTGFTFGAPKPVESNSALNLSKSTFDFNLNKSKSESQPEFVFGTSIKHDFEFKPKSPRKISENYEESDESILEEENDNIYFKPVIPLPDKVDVKTGEENEIVLYSQRTKLFRFVDGEWKERGIGDVKILKNSNTDKLRILMRRDQVHKICLNHWLTKDIQYQQKDEKSWLFAACDFSDGEITQEKFCLRFKNAEIANTFLQNVKKALHGPSVKRDTTKEDSSDSDIEITYELHVSPELEKKALALQLPKNFYAYLDKEPCKGCIGCNDENFVFSTKPKTEIKPSTTSKVTFNFTNMNISSPLKQSTPTSTTNGQFGFSFGGNVFNNQSVSNKTENIFGAKIDSKTENAFASPSKTETPKKNTEKSVVSSNIFGGFKTDTSSVTGNIFSGTTKPSTIENIFGGASTTGNLFSGVAKTDTPSTAGNLFGGIVKNDTSSTTGNLFSGSEKTSVTGNFFSGLAKTDTPVTGNLFSGTGSLPTATAKIDTPVAGNLFSGAKTDTPIVGNFFSGAKTDTPAVGNLFSGTKTDTPFVSGNIFGGKNPDTGNLFSGTAKITPTTGNLFSAAAKTDTPVSGNIFSTATKTDTPVGNLFGETATGNLFSGAKTTTTGNIFGQKADSTKSNIFGASTNLTATAGHVFGAKANTENSFSNLSSNSQSLSETNGPEAILNCSSNLSFASLASSSGDQFGFGTKSESKEPFQFAEAGSLVFGGKFVTPTKSSEEKQKKNVEAGDEEEVEKGDDEYDPHYEPIIPLPEKISVTTGEEDEEIVFCERSKLYRYDNSTKEWKERGVGEFKILFHPSKKTYRLLMRREQVHKLVLNQLLDPKTDFQPLQSSDKAYVWAGHNYSEEGPTLEKLAIKFKNYDLVKKFKDKITEAQANLQKLAQVQTYNEKLDNIRSVIFKKLCTLNYKSEIGDSSWNPICTGTINMAYNPERSGIKIEMINQANQIVSNSIATVNNMKIEDNSCIWRGVENAVENPSPRIFQAVFPSIEDALQMYDNFNDAFQ